MKTALITGVTGQDGYYLAKLLLEKGYIVCGMVRRSASQMPERITDLKSVYGNQFILRYGDLTDSCSINKIVQDFKPDEVYNLGAQSHVQVSFENPEYTANVDALGVLRLLEAVRQAGLLNTRIYHASTSELFGKVHEIPQRETTPFHPRSPYGVSKMFAYWAVVNYREAYDMFACNGILFNHETPIRNENFVTRKITKAVAAIARGKQETVYLGNLDAKRDWGYGGDFVIAMHMILQQDKPDDYVIATGETHSVREFVEEAFKVVGIDITWEGEGVNELGRDSATGKIVVAVDPAFYRPAEVDLLIGDPSKAEKVLGWKRKVGFKDLVSIMVESDLAAR
jgi:GDPmannose 4,6-dehydratase